MKLIGKGSFTKAYLREDGKVELHSRDKIKECMSFRCFPDVRLFPSIKRIDKTIESNEDLQVYEMKYYPKVSSLKNALKPKEWVKYKTLRDIPSPYCKNKYDYYHEFYKLFEAIKSKYLRDAMTGALNACASYRSDIRFEISPRNVAVDNGNLVLLDCFFVHSDLEPCGLF